MKKCFKCKRVLPYSAFYRHKQMVDGHLNKCKLCTKKDVADRYADPEARKRIDEYERKRFHDPDRKKKVLIYQKNRRHRHPEKNKARATVNRNVRFGKLKRMPCEICGQLNAEAHHTNYEGNIYQWLCRKHHRMAESKK